jgi:4-amino-4-deoxy-L-arabinose transferase-like glycosyltransferase
MKAQSTKKTWWNSSSNMILPILIALIFFAFTFAYYPFQEKLQFDTDEGLNLMRSMLVTLGYPLYSQVSSDQPPLFNQILALAFRVKGFDVNIARALVLLFSTLLVWSCAQFLQLTWGNLVAVLFLPLIIMTPRYLDLSMAVMIGVPSIALSTVSMLFLALWHQRKDNIWLVLSGFMLAVSLLIKLFTGFLAPIFFIGITLSEYYVRKGEKLSWKMFRPALIWSISFTGLVTLLVLALIGPRNIWLIIYPHLMAPTKQYFQSDSFSINVFLKDAVPLILLGLLGALVVLFKRNWLTLYPLIWAVVAYVMFRFYSPVFYHHQLLITIPLAMLAAAAVGEGIMFLLRALRSAEFARLETLFGAIALIGFILVSVHYYPIVDKELLNRPRFRAAGLDAASGKLRVLDAMNEYIDQTHWIMTDVPMYAFRVHKPVPPNLATISQKRLTTGSLTDEDILNAMKEYRPEQVLIARFQIPALEDYLQKNYTLIYSPEYFRLFLRNDIKPVSN